MNTINKIKIKLTHLLVLIFALALTIFSSALADESMLSKARVSYRPDGGVSITYFLAGICPQSETETACMDKIFATSPLKDLPYDDISIDQIPKDRSNRDEWRGEKGRGIWIDESLVTKTEKLEELQEELNNELDKESPNIQKVFKLQRKIEKVKELKTANNLLSSEQLAQIEEQKKSFVAAAVQAVGELFGDILNALKEGFLALKSLFVEKVQVGTADKPAGITVYDFETRQPYCVIVRGGKVENIPGPCTFEANPTSSQDTNSSSSEGPGPSDEPIPEPVVETPPSSEVSPDAEVVADEPAGEPEPKTPEVVETPTN